jgi:hypothetical protein
MMLGTVRPTQEPRFRPLRQRLRGTASTAAGRFPTV